MGLLLIMHKRIHDTRAKAAYSKNAKRGKLWRGMSVATGSRAVMDERGESCTATSFSVGVLGMRERSWFELDMLPISISFCGIGVVLPW
jgi:hypothetical protein